MKIVFVPHAMTVGNILRVCDLMLTVVSWPNGKASDYDKEICLK